MMEDKMKSYNVPLPIAPPKGGLYAPTKSFGSYALLYVSGCGCNIDNEIGSGKLGSEYSTEQGKKWAKNAMLNVLSVLERELGSLDRVRSFVKITVYVAGTDGFYEQPQVANGATALLQELFGNEVGLPTRSAIGVNALPGNIPVEIDALISYE